MTSRVGASLPGAAPLNLEQRIRELVRSHPMFAPIIDDTASPTQRQMDEHDTRQRQQRADGFAAWLVAHGVSLGAALEAGPSPQDLENSEYPAVVRAYLAIETALAKRILLDRRRANAFANTPNNWPRDQEWDDLGQTSHEALWSAARKEAGLPTESAFKNETILGVGGEDL